MSFSRPWPLTSRSPGLHPRGTFWGEANGMPTGTSPDHFDGPSSVLLNMLTLGVDPATAHRIRCDLPRKQCNGSLRVPAGSPLKWGHERGARRASATKI
jgi:hypothetical protein